MIDFPIMLATTFKEDRYPVKDLIVDRKMDGHRAILYNGVFYSRTRKKFAHHIRKPVRIRKESYNHPIDGELYNHNLSFEELTSAIKKENENSLSVEFVPTEIISDAPAIERVNRARYFFPEYYLTKLRGIEVLSIEDIYNTLSTVINWGFEGLILRHKDKPYIDGRTSYVQKLKPTFDAEFEVVDIVPGKGKFKNVPVFVCKTAFGDSFRVCLNASYEHTLKYLENKDTYIGKLLNVQYQNLTAKGIPRFPRATHFDHHLHGATNE